MSVNSDFSDPFNTSKYIKQGVQLYILKHYNLSGATLEGVKYGNYVSNITGGASDLYDSTVTAATKMASDAYYQTINVDSDKAADTITVTYDRRTFQ